MRIFLIPTSTSSLTISLPPRAVFFYSCPLFLILSFLYFPLSTCSLSLILIFTWPPPLPPPPPFPPFFLHFFSLQLFLNPISMKLFFLSLTPTFTNPPPPSSFLYFSRSYFPYLVGTIITNTKMVVEIKTLTSLYKSLILNFRG